MCVHSVYGELSEARENTGFPGLTAFVSHHLVLGNNCNTLQEQPVILTTDPFLHAGTVTFTHHIAAYLTEILNLII